MADEPTVAEQTRPKLYQKNEKHGTDEEDEEPDNNPNEEAAQSTRYLMDDSVGRSPERHNFFTKFISSLRRQRTFLFLSISIVVGWSCVCAWYADRLATEAANDPGGPADRWFSWVEGAGSKFRMIGILFVFAVVFRFNRCYDRWNQGRIIWGKIISTSLDATRMASYWMMDDVHSDRFCRFVVVFAYACKALLRGNSLGDPNEEGQDLVERGFLTQEELDEMENELGWQPYFCLDLLGEILIEAHYPVGGMMFDANHKVHSQLFRAVDGCISNLGNSLGEAIRVRASGLPETYDGLHHVIFYFYFILAPVFFSPTIGWVLPFSIGLEALLIMAFVVMGSDLVQPFGEDRVDLPLEFFCETIEAQAQYIRDRAKRKTLQKLAQKPTGPTKDPMLKTASLGRGIKVDIKKTDKGKLGASANAKSLT